MPYVNPKARARVDPAIRLLVKSLVNSQWLGDMPTGSEMAGPLNYAITRLLLDTLANTNRYSRYALIIGVLETLKMEMYRRLIAPYEDVKAEENGDVYA